MSKSDVSRRDAIVGLGTVVGGVACEYGKPGAVEDYDVMQSALRRAASPAPTAELLLGPLRVDAFQRVFVNGDRAPMGRQREDQRARLSIEACVLNDDSWQSFIRRVASHPDRRQLFLHFNDNYSCRAGAGWMERHGDQRAFPNRVG